MHHRRSGARGVGIDDLAVYVPHHYLPVELLAERRGLEPEKLTRGLGLTAMALPDVYEDTATMAANAVRELMLRRGLKPQELGRLYLGTESALDGAKPTATYTLEMLRRSFRAEHGVDCVLHCDVIDMTFACIGAVDALLNTVDWVRGGEGRVGIVVASDFAKYELGSTGEYTQGAGAVALLIRENPALMSIGEEVGVATRGVHDFFKPVAQVPREELIAEALALAGVDQGGDALAATSAAPNGVLAGTDRTVGIHRVTPVFDGPYSNRTYQARVREAYAHYCRQVGRPADEQPLFSWAGIAMHLPYAAHGRRMLPELFARELARQGAWREIAEASKLGPMPERAAFDDDDQYAQACEAYFRAVGKTPAYRSFAAEQLGASAEASAEVGNLYAGSIWLALASLLAGAQRDGKQLAGKTLGLIGYGSGSKSKVFTGALRGRWAERVGEWRLFERLAEREAIDYDTYEQLHRGELDAPLAPPRGSFALDRISDAPNKEGARYYAWHA